ncbi:MAG TPA: DUF3089 domain-containing protein [Chitinophagaceae bacterium]|nr:DUF3089 domain-containing protein [Chitinophagaceae bacterium]
MPSSCLFFRLHPGWLGCLAALAILVTGCSEKYQAFESRYGFHSRDGRPDYSNLDYWAAHPWKQDPADSIPKPLRGEGADSSVDVFFLHPTTYTGRLIGHQLNGPVDDNYLNAKTDYSTILYQASLFNQHARVFAPRYRQAHLSAFFMKDTLRAERAFDTAYADLRAAFVYYLDHFNQGRPILIAAHSQGSKLAERLLREFFDGKPLQARLVAAYVVGWPLQPGYFSSLTVCKDSLQTGCVCSWRTFRRGYLPSYVRKEDGKALVTNPLTWTTGPEPALRSANLGSVLFRFNRLYPHTTDGEVRRGVLWVRRPAFPWSFLYRSRNYHPGDYNLFYVNVRENIAARIRQYLRQPPSRP